ncbi:MAG: zeta toxin family protein [Prevotellaceae bacterium]|jgi:predicted ABC-type ATPase|nr:zeta toxin family protein [Prevotellaceae bacterium]
MRKDKPKLLIVAGPNGAGKTSVTSQILKHTWIEGCEYINPDNIARDVFGDWNSPEAVIKAAKYATEQREKCIANNRSLIFETVLSAPDKLDFVEKAKAAGYFIRLFFIGTDNPQINASRIARRVMNGGHDVPIPKIINRYYKSIANCSLLASFVDRLYVYDNSTDNVFPELLFRSADGQLAKQYADLHDWAEVIFQAIQSK